MGRRSGYVLSALLALVGCAEPPGQRFEGVVEADAPLSTPMSGTKACVVGLSGSSRAPRNSSNARTSLILPHPRYAPGARVRIGDEWLPLSGDAGAPVFQEVGESWQWAYRDAPTQRPVLPELRGWRQDSILEAIAGRPTMHTYSHVTLTERFVRCGERLSVQAIRRGDTLELVDTNPAASQNALVTFGGIAAACFCFCFLPVGALVFFVLRRHARRQRASEQKERGR